MYRAQESTQRKRVTVQRKWLNLIRQACEECRLKRDRGGPKEGIEVRVKTIHEHIARGHNPFRKDCKECVEGAGKTRPNRRVKHPEAAALSADVAEPFKKEKNKEKCMLVAAYTMVKQDDA